MGSCELPRSLLCTLTRPWVHVTIIGVLLLSAHLIPKGGLRRTEDTLVGPQRRQEEDRLRAVPQPLHLPRPFQLWPWRTGTKQFPRSLGPCTTTAPSQQNRPCRLSLHRHDQQSLTEESFPHASNQLEFLTCVTAGHRFGPGRHASRQM